MKNKVLKLAFIIMMLAVSVQASGCFWLAGIGSSEVGVILGDGISVSEVVGPGRYTNGGWYARIRPVDLTVKTIEWSDPDLVTSDTQPIGLTLAISYHRDSSTECITEMFTKYHSELFNNDQLNKLVLSRVPNAAKNNTAKLTLDQMLKGRNDFAKAISDEITEELASICIITDTVQVSNIAPDPGYMEKLKTKAQVILDRDIASEAVKTAEQNFLKTQAETKTQLELARRENLMNEEKSKVYAMSPEMFRLKQLELIKEIMQAAQPGNMMIFIPEGSDLSFINSNTDKVTPVITGQ